MILEQKYTLFRSYSKNQFHLFALKTETPKTCVQLKTLLFQKTFEGQKNLSLQNQSCHKGI